MGKKRWIQHYNSSQKILLVGEGDFSFAACLANSFCNAHNMVATCLHSKETLPRMHWTSTQHIENLEIRGCLVLYEVDVRTMKEHPDLEDMKFDIIVFNFPHAGHYAWFNERDPVLIEKHRTLVSAYFKSTKDMLEKGGEIHLTTRDDEPYNQWEVEKLAMDEGLTLKEKARFFQSNYPGYNNKRGSISKCNKKFPLNDQCYTFKFVLEETYGGGSSDLNSIIATVKDLHI